LHTKATSKGIPANDSLDTVTHLRSGRQKTGNGDPNATMADLTAMTSG